MTGMWGRLHSVGCNDNASAEFGRLDGVGNEEEGMDGSGRGGHGGRSGLKESRPMNEPLMPKHGGYRSLKSFQIAQLLFDVTVRFCDRYIDRRSRTHDQMVQAARSGVQNIAEGSQASGTSRKMELKLTNVARASIEELRLDYEDFLRQRGAGAMGKKRRAPAGLDRSTAAYGR